MTYTTIDLHWQDAPEVIASYALRGPRGVALIETGPASSYNNLKAGLANANIDLHDISDILVTHIHLDHAGAAGWLARETGATVAAINRFMNRLEKQMAAMRRLIRDRGYDIVHFAGHGIYVPGHPERSAWLMSDGPLWALELRNTLAWCSAT